MHCACNTVQLLRLSTSFLLNHAAHIPELNTLITRYRESYSSVSMSRESKRLKKSRSNSLNSAWQCTDTAFEWENSIVVFPRFARWCRSTCYLGWHNCSKASFDAYFISNVSAKKYQNPFMCVKVIVNQRWDVFETQCIYVYVEATCWLQTEDRGLSVCVCLSRSWAMQQGTMYLMGSRSPWERAILSCKGVSDGHCKV